MKVTVDGGEFSRASVVTGSLLVTSARWWRIPNACRVVMSFFMLKNELRHFDFTVLELNWVFTLE